MKLPSWWLYTLAARSIVTDWVGEQEHRQDLTEVNVTSFLFISGNYLSKRIDSYKTINTPLINTCIVSRKLKKKTICMWLVFSAICQCYNMSSEMLELKKNYVDTRHIPVHDAMVTSSNTFLFKIYKVLFRQGNTIIFFNFDSKSQLCHL